MRRILSQQTTDDSPRAHVAAFGKHPGWDDHIADIGLDTDALVGLKRSLYMEGVGGNIDAATWEKLDGARRISGFHHVFVWQAGQARIAGRMWASRDGKGRSRYPMVVCAQCAGRPLAWLLEKALPSLETVELRAKEVQTADAVRALIDETRAALQADADAYDPNAVPPDWYASGRALAQLAGRAELGGDGVGFRRLLYKIERDLGPFLDPRRAGAASGVPAQHLRVPACENDEAPSLALWYGLLSALLSPAVPLLLIRPVQETWVDIILGEARTPQFFCLLASRESIPFASDIPYTLDPAFMAHAARIVEQWANGSVDPRQLLMAEDGSRVDAGPERGVKRWLGQMKAIFGGG
ncbi:MAG: hypothetical protein JXR37_00775 [Kiritimatiellae bacterium]|nr:hypothetical protein [Kiritimatiellia bacterium]